MLTHLQKAHFEEYVQVTYLLQLQSLNFYLLSLSNPLLYPAFCCPPSILLPCHFLSALIYSGWAGDIVIDLYKHLDALLVHLPNFFIFDIVDTDSFFYPILLSWFIVKLALKLKFFCLI